MQLIIMVYMYIGNMVVGLNSDRSRGATPCASQLFALRLTRVYPIYGVPQGVFKVTSIINLLRVSLVDTIKLSLPQQNARKGLIVAYFVLHRMRNYNLMVANVGNRYYRIY